jgi:hypothetical protein
MEPYVTQMVAAVGAQAKRDPARVLPFRLPVELDTAQALEMVQLCSTHDLNWTHYDGELCLYAQQGIPLYADELFYPHRYSVQVIVYQRHTVGSSDTILVHSAASPSTGKMNGHLMYGLVQITGTTAGVVNAANNPSKAFVFTTRELLRGVTPAPVKIVEQTHVANWSQAMADPGVHKNIMQALQTRYVEIQRALACRINRVRRRVSRAL